MDDPETIWMKMHEREAAKIELKILTGCDGCGRRVIEDERPVPGAAIVQRITGGPQLILCKECQGKPELIVSLYEREEPNA